MHTVSSYRGNRPTNTRTHPPTQTNRQDRLQYTAPQLVRSVTRTAVSGVHTQSWLLMLQHCYYQAIAR